METDARRIQAGVLGYKARSQSPLNEPVNEEGGVPPEERVGADEAAALADMDPQDRAAELLKMNLKDRVAALAGMSPEDQAITLGKMDPLDRASLLALVETLLEATTAMSHPEVSLALIEELAFAHELANPPDLRAPEPSTATAPSLDDYDDTEAAPPKDCAASIEYDGARKSDFSWAG